MAKMKYHDGVTWVPLDAANADTVGGLTPAQIVAPLATKAEYKNSTGSFTTGTTHTVTDAFITVNTFVTIVPTGTKVGDWSVEANAGNFVITSTDAESACAFEWNAVKAGA